jgi:hypothetical protein
MESGTAQYGLKTTCAIASANTGVSWPKELPTTTFIVTATLKSLS